MKGRLHVDILLVQIQVAGGLVLWVEVGQDEVWVL